MSKVESRPDASDRLGAAVGRQSWPDLFDDHLCVHELVERQVAISPTRVAVSSEAGALSYAALNDRANRLARHLQTLGVAPGTLVGLLMSRSLEMVQGLLAALKAGGAYVPLDPSYPSERLAYMLSDSAPKVLLVHGDTLALARQLQQDAPSSSCQLVNLDDPAGWADQAADNLSPMTTALEGDSRSRGLAYVIYTSGSTGKPKGAMNEHRAVVNRLQWMQHAYQLGETDVVLQKTPFSFDVSVWEFFWPLMAGARLVMARPEGHKDPHYLVETIVREGVSVLHFVPSMLQIFLDFGDVARCHSIRQVVCSGEALPAPAIRRLQQLLPDVRLHNLYGPTEAAVDVTAWTCPPHFTGEVVPIGRPVWNTRIDLLGPDLQPVAQGDLGELYIAGVQVGRGYLNRPELSAERFVPDPQGLEPGAQRYRTGDLGRWMPDGELEYCGRNDNQVKVRGFRIELSEIEQAIAACPGVATNAVLAKKSADGDARLVAYVCPQPGHSLDPTALRATLAQQLAEFMLPSSWVMLEAMPLSPSGKVDRLALPEPVQSRPVLPVPYSVPRSALESTLCDAFAAVLGISGVGRDDNFFDLGGTSLGMVRLSASLTVQLDRRVSVPQLFAHASPARLAAALAAGEDGAPAPERRERVARMNGDDADSLSVAIIGMAGRFPGADDVATFWRQLLAEVDSTSDFEVDTLDHAVPQALRQDPNYVRARGVLHQVESFDHAFFGMSLREAQVMDPQQRMLLEVAWECMEQAGYAVDRLNDRVGVFAGVSSPTYLLKNVWANPGIVNLVGELPVFWANDKDYAPLRVAHKLGLRGPAVAVNTACSTSLVAVVQALDALRAGRCEMALAGGASISIPYRVGHLHEEGSMLSSDGRTRPFDAQASGTAFNDGVALVLLKPLKAALRDGDNVLAVIRGGAINNDGGGKASFTAPSVTGQAAVIQAALDDSQVSARDIGYIEAHGTATPLGDPIEVEALTLVHRRYSADQGYCRLGSVKGNVGHLVSAAGAAGLMKTALALHREVLPAQLHFSQPNPALGLAASPFVVRPHTEPWPRGEQRRLAGVSSFGVGGTNAHVVLEEGPALTPTPPASGPQLLLLSARSPADLEAMAARLAQALEEEGETLNLADVAHTLHVGRVRYPYRLAVVADSGAAAQQALRDPQHPLRVQHPGAAQLVQSVWVFPGQGAQYAGMGRGLYADDPVFRAAFDEAAGHVRAAVGLDLTGLMQTGDEAALRPTAVTQPATFCLEYALAQSWLARGLEPVALVGHSVGEFVAAVLAGVMSLADAARLVARRGALMQALPAGAMLSVRLGADAVAAYLSPELSLAADNSPLATVLAGPEAAVSALAERLQTEGIAARRLQTSHAFHSVMMAAAVAPFAQAVSEVPLAAPRIPVVSTLTGDWLQAAEATDAQYWARHLRETVRFSPAVQTVLARHPDAVFLELGPRASLSGLIRQHKTPQGHAPRTVASLGDVPDHELARLVLAQGALWAWGQEGPLPVATPAQGRRRVPLPSYPFARVRCWLEPAAPQTQSTSPPAAAALSAPNILTPMPGSASSVAAMPTSTPTQEVSKMSTTASAAAREARIIDQLKTLLEEVSGLELQSVGSQARFVEMGFDSLTLTQAAQQIKTHFKVPLRFRQLMEGQASLSALAAYLAAALPPEPAAATPADRAPADVPADRATVGVPAHDSASGFVAPQAAAPAGLMPTAWAQPSVTAAAGAPASLWTAAPAEQGALQQLIQQQMQLMSQQLALLAGQSPARWVPPQVAAANVPAQLRAGASDVVPGGISGAAVVGASATAAIAAPGAASAVVVAPVTQATRAPAADDAPPEALTAQTYDVKKAFGAIARIHTQAAELTDRQRLRLEAFVRRYTERTAASKAYTSQHRPHLADPRVVNGFRPLTKEITYQLVVDRTKGSRVWDLDGNEYVDVLNGFGMNLFGWQPEFIQQAVREQLDKGYEIGPQHPLAGEVAQLVCELTGFDRAGLCNTGSEAVMAAVRIARTVTQRNLIVSFNGSYHGTFDEVVVRGGKVGRAMPAAPGIMPGMFGDIRVLDYGTPESLAFIREHADELAAVLVEPVQSRRPDFQPKEFLQELRSITAASGTCLIFDEVITGFRAHVGGVQALMGIRADLATYGKVIGGGFPVGVVAGKREFMDALDGGQWSYGDDSIPTVGVTYFAGTFVRHPLALAAAKASLQYLKDHSPELQNQLNVRTAALANELCAFCKELGVPVTIRHFASLWRVTWLEDHPFQDLLFAMMRSRGVHILDNFPCFMTMAHSAEDIAIIKTAFKESVAELQEAEFLPRRPAAAVVADVNHPPVPHARLGRDKDGNPTWFVPDPQVPGKYVKVSL